MNLFRFAGVRCGRRVRGLGVMAVAAIAWVMAAAPAQAQRFEGKPQTDAVVSGRLLLRVTAPPAPLREGEVVAVRLDGRATEMCSSLPWRYAWDTATVPDGLHTLELVRADVNTGRELIVDVLRVSVRNAAPALQSAVACPRTERDATFQPAIDPLSDPCTALCASGGRLILGTASGGIVEYDPATKKGRRLRVDAAGGVTRAVAVAGDAIWWYTAPPDIGPGAPDAASPGVSIRVVPPRLLFRYSRQTGKVTALDVDDALLVGSQDAANPQRLDVRSIVPWQGRVALIGPRDGRVFDPQTGQAASWTSLLPEGACPPGAALAGLAADARRAVAVVESADPADPARTVRQVWTCAAGGSWSMRSTLQSDAPATGRAFLLVAPDRVVSLDSSGVTQWKIGADDVSSTVYTLSPSAQIWGATERAAMGAGRLWWSRSGRLFHVDLDRGTADVLMPWCGASREVAGLAADGSAAWVAGPAGVAHIELGGPGMRSSYVGYVRARLGTDAANPRDDLDRRLMQIVQEWQGVPYKWGGSSKSGTDCSGFVMAVHRELGVTIPHGSNELRTTPQGLVVKDELQIGDVLTYPGHCALYLGDGRTAETVAGGVGTASIFGRDDVVVRRFLRAPDDPPASRKTRRKRTRTH